MAGDMTGWLIATPPPAGWRFRAPSPQVVPVQQPAAGAQWTWSAERGHLMRLTTVHARLTTNATAGTRRPRLRVRDPNGRTLLTVPAPTVISTTATATYEWLVGSGHAYNGGGHMVMPLVDTIFPPNCTVDVATIGMAAGDAWTVVTLMVELF